MARDRRRNDMEGVGRITTMSTWIGERPEYFEELGDRPRPAMSQHEWHGRRLG
jgi:hypothetical protein